MSEPKRHTRIHGRRGEARTYCAECDAPWLRPEHRELIVLVDGFSVVAIGQTIVTPARVDA